MILTDLSVTILHRCRECGCTDFDCSQCVERTGSPCFWVEDNLCSACVEWETVTLAGDDQADVVEGKGVRR